MGLIPVAFCFYSYAPAWGTYDGIVAACRQGRSGLVDDSNAVKRITRRSDVVQVGVQGGWSGPASLPKAGSAPFRILSLMALMARGIAGLIAGKLRNAEHMHTA